MSSRQIKKKHKQVPATKLKPILKAREILRQTTRKKFEDLPEGIHEISEIDREEGMRRIEEIFRKVFVDTINSGTPIKAITVDYSDNNRSSTSPTIGAIEFNQDNE